MYWDGANTRDLYSGINLEKLFPKDLLAKAEAGEPQLNFNNYDEIIKERARRVFINKYQDSPLQY